MKLATALAERAELQARIQQLHSRLLNNAQVQEGEQPAEDPQELLAELEEGYGRLEELISRINRTNAAVVTPEGSLTDLLARRDCLTAKLSVLRDFLDAASSVVSRRTVGEIKIRSAVDVRQMQKQLDGLSRQLRELDGLIQEKNWTVELL